MKIVIIGLSVSSSWGNGHATTYRALLSALAARGHDISFHEWNAPWYRGEHRDLPDPDFCRLSLYAAWDQVNDDVVAECREADAVIFGSYVHEGPRVLDALLDAGIDVDFFDIDTPVTVAQLRRGQEESIRADQVPALRSYLSFSGGPFLREVVQGELGAREAHALYCSVDAQRYRPVEPHARFRARLAYMGTYAEDRQPGLERLLLQPARRASAEPFLVAGPQYPDQIEWPPNVRRIEHVPPARHPTFYCSAEWQLNLTRADMRAAGYSPSVRLFEAAACGAAIVSDDWPGLDSFLRPGRDVMVVHEAAEVADLLAHTHPDDRRAMGEAARERILAEHTSEHRAMQLERILSAARTAASQPVATAS